jgi:hypothetical protein
MEHKILTLSFLSFFALLGLSKGADFNQDGQQDLLLYNGTTRQLAIWYLNANRVRIGGAYAPTIPAGYSFIDVGDFNGDHHPDLLLYNPSTRKTAIWFLNNNVYIGGVWGPTFSVGWVPIAAADLDGDGISDIVALNSQSGQTFAILLNPDGSIKAQYPMPVIPSGWFIKKVISRNPSGLVWYVLYNQATRKTAIWYISGSTVTGGYFDPTIPNGWSMMDVADFNGDQQPDFVLFNASTRQTAIWYINGNGTLIGGVYGPTLPAGWSGAAVAKLCVFSLIPTSKSAFAGGGNGSFVVGCDGDCRHVSVSNVPWIQILISPYGTGPDTTTYHVDATTAARQGTITVSDRAFPGDTATFTVNQNGSGSINLAGTWTTTLTGTFANGGCSSYGTHVLNATYSQVSFYFLANPAVMTNLFCWDLDTCNILTRPNANGYSWVYYGNGYYHWLFSGTIVGGSTCDGQEVTWQFDNGVANGGVINFSGDGLTVQMVR